MYFYTLDFKTKMKNEQKLSSFLTMNFGESWLNVKSGKKQPELIKKLTTQRKKSNKYQNQKIKAASE